MKTIAKTCLILMLMALLAPILAADAAPVSLPEASMGTNALLADVLSGPDGRVYVVDNEQKMFWRIHPDNHYEQYYPAGEGSSLYLAPDSSGKIWWTDGAETFGYFDPAATSNRLKYWQVPQDEHYNTPDLGPLAILNGDIWMVTWFSASFGLYQFTPGSSGGQLCHYAVSGGSYASDLVAQDGKLWWLNWDKNTLVRFAPTAGGAELVSYTLAGDIGQRAGMAAQGQAAIWWAGDLANGKLSRFTPPNLTTFSLPNGTHAVKVAEFEGRIWYSDGAGTFGSLDPLAASGATVELSGSAPLSVTPVCQALGAPLTQSGAPDTGTLAWSTVDGALAQPQTGLEVYSLPAGAAPLGIAAARNMIWIADDGRDRLVRVDFGRYIYLPMIRR